MGIGLKIILSAWRWVVLCCFRSIKQPQYYSMASRQYDMFNWLFSDYCSFIEDIGGSKNQFTSILYQKFLEEFSQNRHNVSLSLLNNFIDSKDYCMQKKHYSN